MTTREIENLLSEAAEAASHADRLSKAPSPSLETLNRVDALRMEARTKRQIAANLSAKLPVPMDEGIFFMHINGEKRVPAYECTKCKMSGYISADMKEVRHCNGKAEAVPSLEAFRLMRSDLFSTEDGRVIFLHA